MSETLFDKLGGMEAIMAAVDIFYEKVLADDLVKDYFNGIDMENQAKKQVAFMTWAFDGPDEYKGRDLRTAHRRLVKEGMGDAHFDAVATHLKETLEELEVPEELIQDALSRVAGTRDEVLDR